MSGLLKEFCIFMRSSEARQRPDARRRHESARPGAPARAARRRRRWRCRRARGSVCRSWRTVAMQKARRDATGGEKTGHPTLASLEHEGRHIPTEARRHHPLCPSRPKTFLLSLTLQATMAAATMMDVPPMTSAPMPMPLPPAKPMTKEEEREAKKVIRWHSCAKESKECSYLPCTASAATARLSRYYSTHV